MANLTEIDRYIYAGRLKAFLDKPVESVAIFTEALDKFPEDPRLLRYRGHRRLTVRDYPGAIEDLQKASLIVAGQPDYHEFYQRDVEPDLLHIIMGREDLVRDQHIPVNPETIEQTRGMYKSTLHGSIWYHLAVGQYLLGDFDAADASFAQAEKVSVDDDLEIAILDWRYMCSRRAGRDDDAAALIAHIDTDSYQVNPGEDFYLRRLKMYKGEMTAEDLLSESSGSVLAGATQGYGVGNWYLYNGQPERALEVFDFVLQHGFKNAFGYMATERDHAMLAAK